VTRGDVVRAVLIALMTAGLFTALGLAIVLG
jgi:hypothetical protein